MLCPICQEKLQMSERQEVEIDCCPNCQGIWLDQGELQMLIDYSLAQVETLASPVSQAFDHDDDIQYPKRYRPPYYEEHRNGRDHDGRRYDDPSLPRA